MKFTLNAPCKDCPFRSDRPDLKGWLGKDRALSINHALANDGSFSCHKTLKTNDDGESVETENTAFCGGALVYMAKQHRLYDNVLTRAAVIFGLLDYGALNMQSPIFESTADFVKHHTKCKRIK